MAIQINYGHPRSGEGASLAPSGLSVRQALDARLLPFAPQILEQLCGEAVLQGNEVLMRNPLRDDQSLGSFKFNVDSGAWSDFALPEFAGYGLTALYCELNRVPVDAAIAALQSLADGVSGNDASVVKVPAREKAPVDAVDPADVRLPPDLHPDLGAPTLTWEYRDAENRLAFYVYRFDQNGKKETRPVAWSSVKNAWLWQYPQAPYPLYRLPELISHPDAVVLITEGEKAADAAARQFPSSVVITSACGSEQALRSDWSPLKGRDVIIAPDKDNAGKHYALSVASAALVQGAAAVRVIDVWQLTDWSQGDDLADHEVPQTFLDHAVAIAEFADQAELEPHLIKAAAILARGDFDRRKKSLAELLGIGVRTFDNLVKQARTQDADAAVEEIDDAFVDDKLEPWESPVAGDGLFAELIGLISRHIVLSDHQAAAIACWVVFAYGFKAMRICPQLLISSPSKRCGKSTLLELLMGLVPRPLPAANISSSAVFRAIDAWQPTLLIDEADTFLSGKSNEELIGVLNSGHSRNLAFVVRTVETGGEHQPKRFSTFCPKVIAMIKAPADTITDRSIVIALTRKLSDERVTALPLDPVDGLRDTRRRLLRWTQDSLDEIEFSLDEVPTLGNDRARQNWAVLAAFAKVLGPQPLEALLRAAEQLGDTSDVEDNQEVDLLADIREVVASHKGRHIASKVLAAELNKLADRPWGDSNHGKGLTENKLARLLKPFKIRPEKYHDGVQTPRGYLLTALETVFDRYLQTKKEG